jgi:hypothetical protein
VSAAAKLIAAIDFAMMALISFLQVEWLEGPRQLQLDGFGDARHVDLFVGHHTWIVSKTSEENCQLVDRRGFAISLRRLFPPL